MERVTIYAATSLAPVFEDMTAAGYAGVEYRIVTGSTGTLADEIRNGADCDVFAGADLEIADGLSHGPVASIGRSRLAILAHARLKAASSTILDRLIDPQVKLGVEAESADPAGRCAREVFRRAEILRKGAHKTLSEKAITLENGTADSGDSFADAILDGKVDAVLTWETNLHSTIAGNRSLDLIPLPEVLQVEAEFGVTVLSRERPDAWRTAFTLLSTAGRHALANRGFSPPMVNGNG